MKKTKLFIFDMDGLMFETGKLAYQAYYKSAEKHDYAMTHNVYYYLTGRTESGIRQGMCRLYGDDVSYNTWRDSMNEYRNEMLIKNPRVYKKEGLIELLDFAKQNNIVIAVASSSLRERVHEYLKMEELSSYFDIIVAGDEVESGKPNPEIFLKTCKKANVQPSNAVVLEDSIVGIEAAQRAGITSILIRDDITEFPIREGKHPLKKDISDLSSISVPSDYEFSNLREVRDFFEKEKSDN